MNIFICILLLASPLVAPGTVEPSVELAPVGNVHMQPGENRKIELDFRVKSGFHINSNKPKSNLLIPTTLNVVSPKPLQMGTIQYPSGEEQSFAFAPGEKLSVYSGDFTIYVPLKAPTHAHGSFHVGGELYYQACDKNACYPPKKTPVNFDVAVK